MKSLSKKTLVFLALTGLSIAWVFMGTDPLPQAGCGCGASLFASKAWAVDAPSPAPVPRLVDLGASRCIPCKMMAPILEALKKEYEGRMQVDFIDVWQNPQASKQYAVKMIPTQIFYDTAGKELFRHEGFFAKEEILAKWKELGIHFGEKKAAP